jgi:hypothetical protein
MHQGNPEGARGEDDWMIGTAPRAGYEFKGEVLTLPPEGSDQQNGSAASNSRHASLMRWIAERPGLAVSVALAAGVVLTISLLFAWSIVSSMSQHGAEVSAFAGTCS